MFINLALHRCAHLLPDYMERVIVLFNEELIECFHGVIRFFRQFRITKHNIFFCLFFSVSRLPPTGFSLFEKRAKSSNHIEIE